MEKYDLIQRLQRELHKNACDVKAESLVALATEKGLSLEDFIASCDSLFFREYNKDVVFTEIRDDVQKLPVLQLHLSRSGVYDHLPEGLFYQPADLRSREVKAADMALEYKQNKQKEQSIRRFFLPLEHEFFGQRVQVEKMETKLLKGVQSGMLNEYFMEFWGIPASIPRSLSMPLILLLPYADRIVGDLPLTKQCMELILKETVQIKKIAAPVTETGDLFSQQLGHHYLGVDMVCGRAFMEDYPVLQIYIGPLQHSNMADYLEGGSRMEFLKSFAGFFLPVEVEVLVEVQPEAKNMNLTAGAEPLLGYSSVLSATDHEMNHHYEI